MNTLGCHLLEIGVASDKESQALSEFGGLKRRLVLTRYGSLLFLPIICWYDSSLSAVKGTSKQVCTCDDAR